MKKIYQLLGLKNPIKGQLGIEIEVEGGHLPGFGVLNDTWVIHEDGSLRGESAEYVLRKPLNKDHAKTALEYLDETFRVNNSAVFDTVRAGVHIHVNIQDLDEVQMYNFICLYLIFEEIFVEHCGESRVSNMFCLRMRDAEFPIRMLTMYPKVGRHDLKYFQTDLLRYAAINLKAIPEKGSLEFRFIKTVTPFSSLYKWCEILLQLKEIAMQIEKPSDIVRNFSEGVAEHFLLETLGKEHYNLFKDQPDLKSKLKRGIRFCQEVAYCVDWDEWAVEKAEVVNPFIVLDELRRDNNVNLENNFNLEPIPRPPRGRRIPRPEDWQVVRQAMQQIGARVENQAVRFEADWIMPAFEEVKGFGAEPEAN